MGHFREENIVLREVTVQSGKLPFPKEILFAREMRSQLFRDVPVKDRQILVRRLRCSLEHFFDPEMVLTSFRRLEQWLEFHHGPHVQPSLDAVQEAFFVA